MTRILVIDDDKPLLRALHIALTARGYDVTAATSATQALDAATRTTPDLTIIDLGLPDMDGLNLITALRGWLTTPIIVLSARHAEQSKITALDTGADDYITKPFGMGELLARVRATLRRASPTASTGTDQPVITTAAFRIDLAGKTVTTQAGEARLTPTEWQLLELLVRNPGNLVTHQQLLHEIWGPAYENQTAYLRVHIGNLRRKLEPDPTRPQYLRTDPGLGYRFMPDEH
jgi:two-component system, OmpR family, KDP operon response regulator KdpE